MVSQPFDAGRGRSRLPVRPKSSALPPRRRERMPSPTPSLFGQVSRPRPLKSAHPYSRDPVWTEYLSWWKQISTGVAIVSGFSVLSLYSWTVHTQSQWSQRYQVWQQMQRNERQFLLTQESIANSLRETASRSEMVPLVPDRMIEVPIALPNQGAQDAGQSSEQHLPKALQDSAKAAIFYPIGY
ncbi:hypothetical protein L1047_14150 [Synechococcus sp. Nb3U1]|uniref:hypothetical protein n=1 Tax=Synechococcus sp. Nb3U1 TaxID=1914529 RepID=UPI001F1B8039|nr:hypothetical protein [Synechococcus sp. Nb3U1]MCF2972336.1 hypothetical protein [Synechococcus sp. Nb3U1]